LRLKIPVEDRTVGVVARDEAQMMAGYTILCCGRETYLLDADGVAVHAWRSKRNVFAAYLRPNGNLVRDGKDDLHDVAPLFNAGGAAGWIEEVTWDNEVIWSYEKLPHDAFLTHHDIEPMPNGNVLVMLWERIAKADAIAAGRNPELIPDGEVWNQLVIELAPNARGGAEVVWQWALFDHLIQDFDKTKDNYGAVADHPELFDLNFCPVGGKSKCRNVVGDGASLASATAGVMGASGAKTNACGKTGEKDWTHVNGISYDPKRDQIVQTFNVPSEIIFIDHSTTTEEARGHSGGKYGKGGDILYRWGNPQTYRAGSRMEQQLFCPHSPVFTDSGTIICFNNGRIPDRHWSSVDEIELPETEPGSGIYVKGDGAFGPQKAMWSYGPRAGRQGSFYCTHISGCQRLPNGNTFVTMGPQGILTELTPSKEEVWRYVSPVLAIPNVQCHAVVRQGDERVGGRFSLFRCVRYAADFPGLADKDLSHGRHLEA